MIKTALSSIIAPIVNPLVRRYELRKARQLCELAVLAEGVMPEVAAQLRALAAQHALRAALAE